MFRLAAPLWRPLCTHSVSAVLAAERELGTLAAAARDALRRGDFGESKTAATAFREAATEHYGASHPVVASATNNLALAHKHLGEFKEASSLFESALSVYKEVLGEEHPSTITTMSNTGLVFKAMAEAAKGIEGMALTDNAAGYLEHALELRKAQAGPKAPEVALALCHLASVRRLQGNTTDAEELLMEAAAMFEPGDVHPFRGTILNNLGFLLKDLKQFDRARRCYEEAVSVREQVHGKAHIETVSSMHNLAELLIAMGLDDDAAIIQQTILERLGHEPQPPAQGE